MFSPRHPQHQGGAALLLFLLVLVVLSAGQLLRKLNHGMSNQALSIEARQTQAALLEAKQALLGYAASFAARALLDAQPLNDNHGPGRMPCAAAAANRTPRTLNNSCNGVMTGLLPAIESSDIQNFPVLDDGAGNPLVYVFDGNFRMLSDSPPALNVTTPARITLSGQGNIVALIFAPGPSLLGQSRPTGNGAVNLAAFLEDGENTNGDVVYVTPTNISNDAVLAITRDELMCAIRRVVREAEPPSHQPAWFASQAWNDATILAALNAIRCPLGGSSNAPIP